MREAGEVNLYFALPYGDPPDDGLDELALDLEGEGVPPLVEDLRFGKDLGAGELTNGEEVDLPLEPWDLDGELLFALLQWIIALPEGRDRESSVKVQAIELVGLCSHLLLLALKRYKQLSLPPDHRIHFAQVLGDGLR